jgi:hypothetical protein
VSVNDNDSYDELLDDEFLATRSDEGNLDAEPRAHRANPDDPITHRPPAGARGPRPGPDFRGAPGRVAIVQGQIYLVGVILVTQLFLITTDLYELLSGRTALLWWIALAQLLGFAVVLIIYFWPLRRVSGY